MVPVSCQAGLIICAFAALDFGRVRLADSRHRNAAQKRFKQRRVGARNEREAA